MKFNFKLKKEKKPTTTPQGLLIYSEYEMSLKDKVTYFLIAFTAGAVVGYIFYFYIFIGILGGIIAGLVFVPMRKTQIMEKRKQQLHFQFKDLLESLATSLNAGKNIPDAFKSAYDDLKLQYPGDAYILKELEVILSGINNNMNIEVLLLDFGQRSGIADIISFANVFETCYRKGGNIKDVIKNTYDVISDKMEIETEIGTVVTSKKTEHTIMSVMPIILIIMMRFFGGADQAEKLHTPIGVISTTIAVVMFIAAYFIGKRILQIKL